MFSSHILKMWAGFILQKENERKVAAQGVYMSSTLHWKSRLNRNGDWRFMVPEGNAGTRGHPGEFINTDRRVMACHVSSNLMDNLSSLT